MDMIFTNARIVLPDEIVLGSVVVREGRIHAIDAHGMTSGRVSAGSQATSEDMGGDILMPGLVELHTDHLENHYGPRPGVRWDSMSAIQAHDAQIAASGITTVFDCFRVGRDSLEDGFDPGEMRQLAGSLLEAQDEGRLRAEHFIHLRCEVSSPDALAEFETFSDIDGVRLASLMDHAPGQRQFQTMDQYTLYYKTKRGLSDAEFEKFCNERLAQSATYSAPQRQAIARLCGQRGISLASHDDATLAHVDESIEAGVRVAEFPTSLAAARASHDAGLKVLMGAPNVVRGKSHSGNIAARELAENGLLDVLSSDYVPMSLVHAPFVLADAIDGMTLHAAVQMVTKRPAEAVSLDDRGVIEVGRRADLVRVSPKGGKVPVVRSVWREGVRVA